MIALITCLIVALVGFAISTDKLTFRSEEPEITLKLPAASLAPRVASLAGRWEATLPDGSRSSVVVEKISETWATVVYSWPDYRMGLPSGSWQRVTASVLPDGQLRWGFPVRFSLRASEGSGTLELSREATNNRVIWTLKKVGSFVATADRPS